jgi:hypothetical protein
MLTAEKKDSVLRTWVLSAQCAKAQRSRAQATARHVGFSGSWHLRRRFCSKMSSPPSRCCQIRASLLDAG